MLRYRPAGYVRGRWIRPRRTAGLERRLRTQGLGLQAFGTFNGGRPDVVFMAYDPDHVGGIYTPGTGEYVDDYDVGIARAQAYRPGMSKT